MPELPTYNTPMRRVIAAERAYHHAVSVLLFLPPTSREYQLAVAGVREFRKLLRAAYLEQAQVVPVN